MTNARLIRSLPISMELFLKQIFLFKESKLAILQTMPRAEVTSGFDPCSYATQPASIELLTRLAEKYKNLFPEEELNLSNSTENIFYHNNTSPYIALGGVLTGDLPLKLFQEKFFSKYNNNIHPGFLKIYYDLLPEEEKKSK